MKPSKDGLIDILRRLPGRIKAGGERRGCPDEEALASYLSGHLARDARANLERHLANCSLCAAELTAAYRAAVEVEIEQAPQFLVERVQSLVPGRKTAFDLVVRLTQGAVELIRASVPVTWPAVAAPVRGVESPSTGKVLQLSKDVGRFKVTVELEVIDQGSCQLDVHVRGGSGQPAEGIRLSLSSDGRERASFLTPAGGEVVFERILPADYQLAISDRGGLVGAIELSLTREL
jgi:hypothetical protein